MSMARTYSGATPVINQAVISTEQLLQTLDQLLSLPGSSGQYEDLAAVAARVAALMRVHGLHVETIATPGAPVVIGHRAGRQPFTVLLYHHYDTPSTGPWRAWHHEPFQLAEREAMLYGRGVADGKGPLAAHLSAISALIEAEGELPCGVVIVAEGEGLSGSPHLGAVLAEHRQLLQADACLSTGGERDKQGRPICYSGVKGLLQVRLRVSGALQALPPGMAASVPNPLWRLLWALSQIKSDQEEVLINGFYDDVEGPSRTENQALRAVTLDEAGRKAAWGLPQFLFGLDGATLVRTESTMPTCNVAAVQTEPSGDFSGIPVAASARIDFQLVPHQLPLTIADLLLEHLASKQLHDISVEQLPGGYAAAHTLFEHPFVQLVSSIGQHVYSMPLALLPHGPFAQPLALFVEAFGIPIAALGCARFDSATNAPNEHIPLPDLVRHGQLLIELLDACAAQAAEEAQAAK
jgi:acetylornithine deacetylase/succinyl-diaminopimelate desuccinylase-like protein